MKIDYDGSDDLAVKMFANSCITIEGVEDSLIQIIRVEDRFYISVWDSPNAKEPSQCLEILDDNFQVTT